MKALIDIFQINGTSSYPTGVTCIESIVTYGTKEYYVAEIDPDYPYIISYDDFINRIRIIHKSDFIERMLPYWSDIKATREADVTVDGYFEMFNHYKYVDLDWAKTQAMVTDLVQRVKVVVPTTDLTVEVLLADGSEEEKYS